MSVSMMPLAGSWGALVALVILRVADANWPVVVAGAIITGAVAVVLYLYSPLPSHNGGWGAPPARWQKWGFTSEPARQYEQPSTDDMMRPALSGINFASPKDTDDDSHGESGR
jgi:hypothetical protein